MKEWRNILQPVWRWALAFALVIAAITWAFFVSGCTSPVVPHTVTAGAIAWDGADQNAGVLEAWPGKGALITETKKAEWDALVARYGRGTVGHPLTPPVTDNMRGFIRVHGNTVHQPMHEFVWFIDPQALEAFILFKAWQDAAREPL